MQNIFNGPILIELLINVLTMFQKCVKDMMYCFEDGPNSDE